MKIDINRVYSKLGLTGSQERLALLRQCEELYDNNNQYAIAKMNELASRWPDELYEIYNIQYYDGCADKYAYQILGNCDDVELQEIVESGAYESEKQH